MRSILVVDDELGIRKSLEGALKDEGYRVLLAETGQQALEMIASEKPDLVLLDIWMPGMDGMETLSQLKARWPHQSVLMMSGHGRIEMAVKATKLGAFDFAEKPLSLERLLVLFQNVFNLKDLERENDALRQQLQKGQSLLGRSAPIRSLLALIQKVAPTMGSVLITGENGTGKELVAQSLHRWSSRHDEPFIEVNCAAIPEELIESELFGHEKGAFTGATQLRRGKFDLAHGGTLFLDEIGDMSLKTQAKILRILQEQKFERVGGSQTIGVDVRVVAATNKDLRLAIEQGNFREDLFYRLNVIAFVVPPLRDRGEDIALLADHFLELASHLYGKELRKFSDRAYQVLRSYAWPGNVRELKNLMERVVILSPEPESAWISDAEVLSHFQDASFVLGMQEKLEKVQPQKSDLQNLRNARQEFEKAFILKTLHEYGGNISKAAQVLGIERSHLHRKMKSFGIE